MTMRACLTFAFFTVVGTTTHAQVGPVAAGGWGGRLGIVGGPIAGFSQQINLPALAARPGKDLSTNVFWLPGMGAITIGAPVQPGRLMAQRIWGFPPGAPGPFVFTGVGLPAENPYQYTVAPQNGLGGEGMVTKRIVANAGPPRGAEKSLRHLPWRALRRNHRHLRELQPRGRWGAVPTHCIPHGSIVVPG